jgi:polyhydroxybutyrate depolymerase
LVIALHGAYRSGAFMERYTGLSRLADREGFAVAYPDASSSTRHFWTLHPGRGPDDVAFISALIDRAVGAGCVDAARVSAVGVSNGGGLAALLACEASGRLAAIVAVAGGYGDLPECRPDRPLSVLEIHGTADRVVPYHAQRGDVLEWLRAWARRDGCAAATRRRAVVPGVTRMDWRGCASRTRVAHLAIRGGEHAWPGANPPDPGPRVGLSATDETWRFLRTLRRVRPAAPAHPGGAAGRAAGRARETP